ncbi:hypothetical protein pb186bvf_014723 [Paramecium bursaria]
MITLSYKNQKILILLKFPQQLIAYGGDPKILTVYDLITKQNQKKYKLVLEFKDVYFQEIPCYCIVEIMKYFYIVMILVQSISKSIKTKWINVIILIDNDQIASCSDDNSIKIIDISQEELTLDNEIAQILISCSSDGSIKFFSQQQNSHKTDVYQIQLTNENKNLKQITKRVNLMVN